MTIPESSEVRCLSQFRNRGKCAVVLFSGIAKQRIPELQQVRCCSQFRNRQNGEFLNFVGSRWQKVSPVTLTGLRKQYAWLISVGTRECVAKAALQPVCSFRQLTLCLLKHHVDGQTCGQRHDGMFHQGHTVDFFIAGAADILR